MRKKILLLAVSLMMFMGVVSASSINGDYKGNPIVKVMSNGKQLQSDEVPAMIYDGHTVVPISLLRQLGASVEWNANTYSVDVSLPTPASNISSNQIIDVKGTLNTILPAVKQIGGKDLKFIYDEYGSYVSVRFDGTHNSNTDVDAITQLATISTSVNFQETRVIYHIDNVYQNEFVANNSDAQLWIDKKITASDFTNRIKIMNVSNLNNSSQVQNLAPQVSNDAVTQAKCSIINRDYDSAIGRVKVDFGARGIRGGSLEINAIKKLNDERNDKLIIAGCATK